MTDFWLMYWNVDKPPLASTARPLDGLARAIAAATSPAPSLIAFSEVQNGEVLKPLADSLMELTGRAYRYTNLHRGEAKAWLDAGVLYDVQDINSVDVADTVRGGTGSHTRRCAACRCVLTGGQPFLLYVNHWWSQPGNAVINDAKRRELARWLWHSVRAAPEAHVVAVGDFNVEPFDAALTATAPLAASVVEACPSAIALEHPEIAANRSGHEFGPPLTTRQAAAAPARPGQLPLFNPTWRLMNPVAGSEADGRSTLTPPPGSFYYPDTHTWHAFDQLLVSGAVLQDGPLRLDERSVHYATPASPDDSGGALLWNADQPDARLSKHFPLLARFRVQSPTGA